VIDDLARLHSAYWNKGDTLREWDWLARPTTADAAGLAAEGLAGLTVLSERGEYDQALTPDRVAALRTLAQDPASLLSILNDGPFTLLHGDAGFQNIALTSDGRQRIWYDWQLVAAGPPALDLITFLHPWAYPEANPALPLADMVELYLEALRRRGHTLPPELLSHQIDAALLWRWIIQWAPLLGQYRERLQPEVRERLYAVFEQRHWPALERWSGGVIA
jgi:thiamine kinase-like enzyme